MPAVYSTHNPGFTGLRTPPNELSAVKDLIGLRGVVPDGPVFPRYARARFGMFVYAGKDVETDIHKTAALLRENFFWSIESRALFHIGNACKTVVGNDPRFDGDYVSVPRPRAFPKAVDFPHIRLRHGNSPIVECRVQANLHEAVLVYAEEPLEEVSVRRWERKVVGRNLGANLEIAVKKVVDEKINLRYSEGSIWVYETASS